MSVFTSPVITGSGRGQNIGFPTLNLDSTNVPDTLETGVYACFAQLDDNQVQLAAAMHYGPRPTFADAASCEVHIIDHSITVPPTTVTVTTIAKLRDVEKFASPEALTQQLQADIGQARAILETS